jgi:hypothetical protein
MTRVLGGVNFIGFFLTSHIVFVYRAWLKYVSTPPTVDDTLNKIVFSLMYANSAINVFFYGFFKKDFRSEITKLFSLFLHLHGLKPEEPLNYDH